MWKVAISNTPRLPPEVCLAIIEWATFVPNALDTHAPNPFAYPAPKSQDDIQQSIRESMYTKRSLVLVCKAWNRLATPFLYQAISIFRENVLAELLYSLNGSGGRWTRYLCVLLPLGHCGTRDELEQLLWCLPNLQIIIVREKHHMPMDAVFVTELACIFEALALQTIRSLHVFNLAPIGQFDLLLACQVDGIPAAMKVQPLRVLTIQTPIYFRKESQLCVSNAEYLDVPRYLLGAILAAESLPSALSCLSLYDGFTYSTDRDIRRALSPVEHGHLMLDVDDIFRSISSSEENAHRITDSCPNLRYLIIELKNELPMSTKKLPPVEKLGLRPVTPRMNDTSWWWDTCKTLESLLIGTPSVKVVRIFATPKAQAYTERNTKTADILRQTSVILSKRGVRFEDCTGQLFHSD